MVATSNDVGFFLPLFVALVITLVTITIHALAFRVTVHYMLRKKELGHAGASFERDVGIVAVATLIMLTAHLIEIAVWAAIFVVLGQFGNFAASFLHSAVYYTSLGLDDIFMSPAWMTLAPLETVDGMLMFGLTTAMLFAIVQRLLYTRLSELNS